MATSGELVYSHLRRISDNKANHRDCKCVNCAALESQLKDALLELSSSQFIIKLLYKELSEVQDPAVPRAHTVNEVSNATAASSTWSKATPINFYDKDDPVNTNSLDPWPLPQSSNRFSVLSHIPEPSKTGEESIPSKGEVRYLENKHRIKGQRVNEWTEIRGKKWSSTQSKQPSKTLKPPKHLTNMAGAEAHYATPVDNTHASRKVNPGNSSLKAEQLATCLSAKNFKGPQVNKIIYGSPSMNHPQNKHNPQSSSEKEDGIIPTIVNGVINVDNKENLELKHRVSIENSINSYQQLINKTNNDDSALKINHKSFLLVTVTLRVLEVT
jgi:hypothetical protein